MKPASNAKEIPLVVAVETDALRCLSCSRLVKSDGETVRTYYPLTPQRTGLFGRAVCLTCYMDFHRFFTSNAGNYHVGPAEIAEDVIH